MHSYEPEFYPPTKKIIEERNHEYMSCISSEILSSIYEFFDEIFCQTLSAFSVFFKTRTPENDPENRTPGPGCDNDNVLPTRLFDAPNISSNYSEIFLTEEVFVWWLV